ncbi:MAG: helix-turn-helix transcriptional regulator, partial [Waterburya sp.]
HTKLKTVPEIFFCQIYETELPRQGLIHNSHPACEYNEHSFQQHGIVVHLKPEQNSLRRMGDCVEIENVNVGDVAIIPAKVNHWQRIETEITEGILLTIEPQAISHIAYETINSDKVELLPTFAQPDPLIQNLALNLQANLDSGNYDRLYAESLFNVLSMHLLKHYCTRQFQPQEYKGGLPPYKLRQATDYINANLDRKLKLDDVAQLIDLSQFYFCHLFKHSTGIAPYKYIIQQRIAKAKQLIKQNKLPLAEIAFECGFSSQSQMTQHFRKCVGVTPKAYQNQ